MKIFDILKYISKLKKYLYKNFEYNYETFTNIVYELNNCV